MFKLSTSILTQLHNRPCRWSNKNIIIRIVLSWCSNQLLRDQTSSTADMLSGNFREYAKIAKLINHPRKCSLPILQRLVVHWENADLKCSKISGDTLTIHRSNRLMNYRAGVRFRATTFQTTWNSLTFPVEASKDYPVSSVYRYGQRSLFHINEKQGEAR